MEYCYHFQRYREQEWIGLGLFGLFFYIFLEWTLMLLHAQNLLRGVVCVGGMAFGFIFSCIMAMAYLEICRKYSITKEGMVIKYPLGIKVKYSWQEFSEIGICKVHYTTRGPVEYKTAIRCVIGEEKNGPKNGHGRWAGSFYSATHFRKIITILYSKERLEEFNRMCPMEIQDYRGIKRYFHDPE